MCDAGTGPIDIVQSSVAGDCELKCAYGFSYRTGNCTATHRDNYISLSYDGGGNGAASYNGAAYDVSELRLYWPSLHTFGGARSDAELVIAHSPSGGGAPGSLLVCVPVQSESAPQTSSSAWLAAVVEAVATLAPEEGDSTPVGETVNLAAVVPAQPYFAYTATEPYPPCAATVDYIVFDPLNAGLVLPPDSLKTLQRCVAAQTGVAKPAGANGVKLFLNSSGPNGASSGGSGSGSGDIYIDCAPVGQSDDVTWVGGGASASGGSSGGGAAWPLLQSPLLRIAAAALLFIGVLWCLRRVVAGAAGGGRSSGIASVASTVSAAAASAVR